MAVTQATRLGCGRDVDDVWDHIDQAPNEHEQTCPYCTKARADLAELSAATHDLAVADRDDSTLRVPDRMLSDVLAIVRTEVRRGRSIPLQHRAPGDGGDDSGADRTSDLSVSEQVIATVVREVCDRNPDVEVRRVGIEATPLPTAAGGAHGGPRSGTLIGVQPGDVEPADVTMELQVMVRHDTAIPALLGGLRSAIQSAVSSQIGVTVSRITIDVQDLIDA